MGNRVREYRIKRGLSQEELARRAGVSRYTIINIENEHEFQTKVATLERIASALGVSIKTLFLP